MEQMEELMQSQAMYFASLIGSIAFAISGFLVGSKKGLDWIGLFILSFLTANGGGIIRDVLINRMPLALSSNEPFLIVAAVTALGSLFKLQRYAAFENRWVFVVCDAVGLVAFAITGALVASAISAPFFGYIMLAFLTATGGAILRDILVNEVPEVLHSGFYGSIAILVATTIYILTEVEAISALTLLAVAISGVCLRLVAYQCRWKLPKL